MTRTNGLTQLLLAGIPLFQPIRRELRWRNFAGIALGIIAVFAVFLIFAAITGSSLLPRGTYANLAMTYFTEQSISWEGMLEARSRFDGLFAVLTYDPVHMITQYIRDLIEFFSVGIFELNGAFLGILFLPGLIFLAGDHARATFLFFLLAAAAQVALVNFKAFDPRFYLFLTPWIGAGTAYLAIKVVQSNWRPLTRMTASGLIVGLMLGRVCKAYSNRRIMPILTMVR